MSWSYAAMSLWHSTPNQKSKMKEKKRKLNSKSLNLKSFIGFYVSWGSFW